MRTSSNLALHPYPDLLISPGHSLPTPKLSTAEKQRTLYPYYAGFSERFVDALLDRMNLGVADRIFDPWLGAGTTTSMAARRGAKAYGFDLNPVMVTVANARSASRLDIEQARLAWRTARGYGGNFPAAAPHLQARAVARQVRATATRLGLTYSKTARALIDCVLAESVRRLGTAGKTSNPTWFKDILSTELVGFGTLRRIADTCFDRISGIFDLGYNYPKSRPVHILGDSNKARINPGSIDAVLTSPPYLTRIDYVKATLPELRYLTDSDPDALQTLRRAMLGTPLSGSFDEQRTSSWGPSARDTLSTIAQHSSKASATYYRSFYARYFDGLSLSLTTITDALRLGGLATLVIQRSHYKEIPIFLEMILAEMAEIAGLDQVDQLEYISGQSMANVNSRAASRTAGSAEYVLTFRKNHSK